MNLLEETIEDIERSGHTPEDIIFIGSRFTGHHCSWTEFKLLADKQYDSGFGSQKVAQDLEIVFSDNSTMWREEYDGSEWWSYSKPFAMPQELKPIQSVFVRDEQVGWRSLKETSEGDE